MCVCCVCVCSGNVLRILFVYLGELSTWSFKSSSGNVGLFGVVLLLCDSCCVGEVSV